MTDQLLQAGEERFAADVVHALVRSSDAVVLHVEMFVFTQVQNGERFLA